MGIKTSLAPPPFLKQTLSPTMYTSLLSGGVNVNPDKQNDRLKKAWRPELFNTYFLKTFLDKLMHPFSPSKIITERHLCTKQCARRRWHTTANKKRFWPLEGPQSSGGGRQMEQAILLQSGKCQMQQDQKDCSSSGVSHTGGRYGIQDGTETDEARIRQRGSWHLIQLCFKSVPREDPFCPTLTYSNGNVLVSE